MVSKYLELSRVSLTCFRSYSAFNITTVMTGRRHLDLVRPQDAMTAADLGDNLGTSPSMYSEATSYKHCCWYLENIT